MSESIEISDFQVVDSWHDLKLGSKNVNENNRVEKDLRDIFANFGHKIVQSISSNEFKTIQLRYNRITKKILENNKVKTRSRYHGFKSEKVFFSDIDFPQFCAKEVPKR